MSDPFPKDPQIDYPRHYEAFLNATLGAVLGASMPRLQQKLS